MPVRPDEAVPCGAGGVMSQREREGPACKALRWSWSCAPPSQPLVDGHGGRMGWVSMRENCSLICL
jgi:hypothetical protein